MYDAIIYFNLINIIISIFNKIHFNSLKIVNFNDEETYILPH